MLKRRIFAAYGFSSIVEDIIVLRLKVPRNERWILREFRATSLGWTNAEALLRATGVIRGRLSTETPQAPLILSTPVEHGEDITIEFSNYVAVNATVAMHLAVDIYA